MCSESAPGIAAGSPDRPVLFTSPGMGDVGAGISFTNLRPDGRFWERYWQAVIDRRCVITLRADYSSEVTAEDALTAMTALPGFEVAAGVIGERREQMLLVAPTAVIALGLSKVDKGTWLDATVCAQTREDARAAEALLRERLPERPKGDEGTIPVIFWNLSAEGPKSHMRSLEVPAWPEVTVNYPESVRQQLEPFMNGQWRPGASGKLFLWQGPPGTGKTYALRALMRTWREWCDAAYVTDPERFFGDAAYMLEVLLASTDKWRLVIVEDAGELASRDAKERTGQGLSRLLNCADGLIGQGLKTLILLTTNEDLRDLHEAVQRPGRCAGVIRFDPFGADEARRWLEARSKPADGISGECTLAELFSGGTRRAADRGRIGFSTRPASAPAPGVALNQVDR